MAPEHYRAFIEEAFITPIRSVLIVDDDYPTYADILGGTQSAHNTHSATDRHKAWRDDPGRIERVIRKFRERTPPLLVDIHDGSNVPVGDEIRVAKHLHQSDLLVLDYQLEPDRQADGTRAVEILRSLMSNAHFNLVIIYTRKEIDSVFDEVRWGLINPTLDTPSKDEIDAAEQLIDAGEDEFDGFRQRISGSITSAQYFHFRLHRQSYRRMMAKDQQPYSTFKFECDRVRWDKDQRNLVLLYFLRKVERENRVNTDDLPGAGDLSWSLGSIKWIKSDSVFVAFSEKADDDDLLFDLQAALNDWNPRPSRLLLTKLRAEMDEHGIALQGQPLSNHYALAYWYYRLLCAADKPERRWRIAESVSRHSDRLISCILPRVEHYVARLIDAERKASNNDAKQICSDHFKVDLADDKSKKLAALQHNAFVCSMEPEGWHLSTGHIFSIDDEHWVCLSAACDMVPSRIPKWRRDAFGEQILPFIAIRLRPTSEETLLQYVQANRFVALQIDGKLRCFCFNDPPRDNSAPHWCIFYAGNSGVFLEDDFRLSIFRTEKGKTRLISKRYDATVVSQLRYEYALNLIQKLGISLTRIGLDFVDGQVQT